MKMYPTGERRQQRCMRRTHVREEFLQVGARFEHQGAPEFAVERMLHHHIQNLDAMVEQNLEFFFRSLRCVLARQDRPMRRIRFGRQAISRRRRQNFLAARPEYGDVLDQALAAHAEMVRELAARNGPSVITEPRDDLAAASAGGIAAV
jgi:hypothetical protein